MILFRNPVYILTMLTMSSIYFSSTGIQFWTILYLQNILDTPQVKSQFIFVLCAATSPIPGALLGSAVADAYGGYKGKNQVTALKICCIFACFASIFAVWLVFINDNLTFTFALWMLLFLGASMVPTAYGIIVSSVGKEL